MKVLYIGHFYENSGYSYASMGYVQSLLAAGVDVVCRNVKLNSSVGTTPEFISELESKNLDNVTHVIQHVLPHHMSYIPHIKNIGLCVYDLSSMKYCEWNRYLGCMDSVIFPLESSAKKLLSDIYNPHLKQWSEFDLKPTPYHIIPHAFDTSKYTKSYDKLQIPELGGSFVFYTIADLSSRKNLIDTVIAFHSEFHSNEPVNLVIKTSKFGNTAEQTAEILKAKLTEIKSKLKIYPDTNLYKPEIIITHSLTEDQIGSIHNTGNCYVNSSRGEGWCMPQFDAWAYGNDIVYYTDNEMYDYFIDADISEELLYPVKCSFAPCYGYDDTFSNIGTANERWLSSNILGLMSQMRKSYDRWQNEPAKLNHQDYEKYSYQSVGQRILDIL